MLQERTLALVAKVMAKPARFQALIGTALLALGGCSSNDETEPKASGGTGVGPTMGNCQPMTATNTANLTVTRSDIGARRLGTLEGEQVIRIARDPSSGAVYYMNRLGQFWQLDLTTGTSTLAEMGQTGDDFRGMVFGSDGTLYLLGHVGFDAADITVVIQKGVPDGNGGRSWSTIATSEIYPAGGSDFDHRFAGLELSPDEQWLYFGSGSRTDHGEVERELREVPLTAAIFRVPTDGKDILLENDEVALEPYVFARGFRNPFDLALNAEGELFATENGPDMDLPEEINWVREGMHYGFPWRFGAEDNPVLDPAYTGEGDQRLHKGYQAADRGSYTYDAEFPAAPAEPFVDAIVNHGPDADRFRLPDSGVLDASNMGQTIAGLSAHRSPLGLSFDTEGVLCGDYQQAGFVLSYGPVLDVMGEPGGDLLMLNLSKEGGEYTMRATQLVIGFETVVDSLMIGNKLYVIEFAPGGAVYELTFPLAAR